MLVGAAVAAPQQYLDRTWMDSPWTESDGRLVKARKAIDAMEGNTAKLDALIAKTRKACQGNKVDAETLYWWAYAIMVRMRGDFDYWRELDQSTTLKAPYQLFPNLSKPKDYEFTRVRFLFTVTYDFPHRSMISLGERLKAKDPGDLPVCLALLHLYQPQAFPQDRTKGEELVKYLDSKFKANPSILASTGYFYYLCWQETHSKADAAEAMRRSGEARKGLKSAEQRRLIDQERKEMQGGG